jgi:hypothetical protein
MARNTASQFNAASPRNAPMARNTASRCNAASPRNASDFAVKFSC